MTDAELSELHTFVRGTLAHHGIQQVHTALVADLIYGLKDRVAAHEAKQAQAEPVAVLTMFDMRSQTGTVDLQGGWEDLRVGDALYTHPAPKRDPLTDEMIVRLSENYSLPYSLISFARAIEAAHGITKDTL